VPPRRSEANLVGKGQKQGGLHAGCDVSRKRGPPLSATRAQPGLKIENNFDRKYHTGEKRFAPRKKPTARARELDHRPSTYRGKKGKQREGGDLTQTPLGKHPLSAGEGARQADQWVSTDKRVADAQRTANHEEPSQHGRVTVTSGEKFRRRLPEQTRRTDIKTRSPNTH